MFFDSKPWLESDDEDFLSVNGGKHQVLMYDSTAVLTFDILSQSTLVLEELMYEFAQVVGTPVHFTRTCIWLVVIFEYVQ